jgi:TPR repeat protein
MTTAIWLAIAATGARAQNGRDPSDGVAGSPDGTLVRSIDDAVLSGRFAKAAALIARSANSGNAEAQYQLGSLYRSGRGVPVDERLALNGHADVVTRLLDRGADVAATASG